MTRFSLPSRFAIVLAAAFTLAGCLPGISAPIPTPTPDRTLPAISRMLTLTATAPTITLTPLRSPTRTPSPSPTHTSTPYPGHPELPGKIGQRMQSDGVVFTVLGVENPAAIPGLRAIAGQHYVEFDVLVENPTTQEQQYNRLLFRLAPQGDETEASYQPLSAATGPLLLSGTLRPGEWVRGQVAFAVADDAPALWLMRQAEAGQAEIWVDPTQRAAGPATVPATGAPAAGDDDLPGTGQRVSASGITLSVDNTSSGKTYERFRAAKDKNFFILDVTITNEARDRAPYNAGYFRLKDADGYEYTTLLLPSDALIIAGSLGRGQSISGKVFFELPVEVRPRVVKFLPQVLFDPYEEIRVRVGE